jgi:hypothetical protein
MSRFLSPKYLKYRGALGAVIEDDVHCVSCGYNLRGLERGRNCPECGDSNLREGGLHDVMLSGGEEERGRWRLGLALAGYAVAIALVSRIGYFIIAVPGASQAVTGCYVGVGALASVLWVVGVWRVTPASLLVRWPWMKRPRLFARGLSLMFLLGYACLIGRHVIWPGPTVTKTDEWLLLGDMVGRFLGGIGVMFTAFILCVVAAEAELEAAARRLNAAVWILWFPTLLAQAFPAQVAWFTLVILGMVLFFWGWLVALMLLGIVGLYRHVRWADLLAVDAVGRPGRIVETRRAIDAQVEASIRPMPKHEGDVRGMHDGGGA